MKCGRLIIVIYKSTTELLKQGGSSMKYAMSFLMVVLISMPVLTDNNESEAKLIALRMYADWCGKCKALDPKVDEVKKEFRGRGVLFAVFDQTDEFAQEQSVLHARLLGLDHVQRDFGGQTGLLLLIDPESRKIKERITHQISIDELRTKLTAYLN
jgi:thiol-disulfide isomerase/thioredoxin